MTPDVPLRPGATEADPPGERAAALAAVLGDRFEQVEWVAETGSTNTDLLERRPSAASNRVVRIADLQTRGRGRLDRSWHTAPEAALLMSVSLMTRPTPDALGRATTALGLAACEAVHALGFQGIGLKWPNDLVLDTEGQPKLAGVLAQSVVVGDRARVVAGMGLNVRNDELERLVPDRPTVALSDLGAPPDRVLLAAEILRRFDPDAPDLWKRYRGRSVTIGRAVRVQSGNETLLGTADDITDLGALVLATGGGAVEIVAGDVTSLRLDV